MREEDLLKKIIENNNKSIDNKANDYSPLNLAYIGDAVFDILVRSMVMSDGNRPVNQLNKISSSIVNAGSQSKMYHKIEDKLTDEEMSIMRRGRNAKSFTHAKNASISDYRHATGLEALFGYLYLKSDIDRIIELFNICVGKNND